MTISLTSAVALLASLLLLGCGNSISRTEQQESLQRVVAELASPGPWTEPAEGLRYRIRLRTADSSDDSAIDAAIEAQNVTNRPIDIPTDILNKVWWRVGTVPIRFAGMPPAAEPSRTITLDPGASCVGGVIVLPIPPGPAEREIAAELPNAHLTATIHLKTPATDWGVPDKGVRSGLVVEHRVGPADKAPALYLFIQNLNPKPIVLAPPDLAQASEETRDATFVISTPVSDDQRVELIHMEAWVIMLPYRSLLAPGKYRIRFIVNAKEQPADRAAAWFGRIFSNEAELEVR